MDESHGTLADTSAGELDELDELDELEEFFANRDEDEETGEELEALPCDDDLGDGADDNPTPAEDDEDDEDDSTEPQSRRSPRPARYPRPPCRVVVAQGDCMASLSRRYRLLPETIWDDPQNAGLREDREPNLLLPGDEIAIPAPRRKEETAPSEARHRFRLCVPQTSVSLRLLRDGEPRANLEYELTVGDQVLTGRTAADGRLEETVPATAMRATLRLLDPEGEETHTLGIGALNPIEDVTGVQARLANLGFSCGAVDGDAGQQTTEAVAAFQSAQGLEPTGSIDDTTRERLRSVHGS